MLASDEGGLPYLIKQVLGDGLGTVFVVASAVAIFVCTLAVQANAARVLFAMARDRALPLSRWLGMIDSDRRTPVAAAVVVGVLGAGLLLVNVDFDKVMSALVCVAVVWTNLAYLLTTGPQLVARLRGTADRDAYLGRWGLPINLLAVVWGVLLVVNIGWPRAQLYGEPWYQQYGALLYTAVLLAVGLGVFLAVRPDRHAAGAAP
jgi:amino acid transporter